MEEKHLKHIDGVGWRYDTEHSMLRRMVDHDYQSRCIYMLTLTLANRQQPLLGRLQWKSEDARGCVESKVRGSLTAALIPSPLGEKVASEWFSLCHDNPQLDLIRLQLMPDHLHVVLFVKDRIPKHLGKYIGIVKNRCNKHYWKMLTEQGLLGPKGTETPPSLFSANFQDSILIHDGQLEAMVNYVEQNPYRALVKRENREMFTILDNVEVGGIRFAAIGNRWLLDRGVRMQVRCHNNTTPANLQLIARQKEYFLDRGKKGGVVVSPCISAGERMIARAALDAGQPLIVILENGFSQYYKPSGKYFDACAKGLLLMLAPWPYHMEKRTITRNQCLALNEMARTISNDPWTPQLERMLSDGQGEWGEKKNE